MFTGRTTKKLNKKIDSSNAKKGVI